MIMTDEHDTPELIASFANQLNYSTFDIMITGFSIPNLQKISDIMNNIEIHPYYSVFKDIAEGRPIGELNEDVKFGGYYLLTKLANCPVEAAEVVKIMESRIYYILHNMLIRLPKLAEPADLDVVKNLNPLMADYMRLLYFEK
jgi:hypothetical protein